MRLPVVCSEGRPPWQSRTSMIVGIGVATDTRHSKIPCEEYQRLIPEVQQDYMKRQSQLNAPSLFRRGPNN